MKKLAAIAACVVMTLSVVTGCTKSSENIETESETMTETETETSSETETESESASETEAETEENTIVEFDSDFGYHVSYDKSAFSVNGSNDYDELDLKGQSFSSKPLVFFAATKVENDQVADIMEETFGDAAQETSIGVNKYKAISLPSTEKWEKGNGYTYHNQYLIALANGDALMFEIQWYISNDEENDYSLMLTDILDSLVIDLPVQGDKVIDETNYMESETETEISAAAETAADTEASR